MVAIRLVSLLDFLNILNILKIKQIGDDLFTWEDNAHLTIFDAAASSSIIIE